MAAFAIFVTEYFFTIKSAARPMVAARRTACPQPFKFLARFALWMVNPPIVTLSPSASQGYS